MTVLSAEDLFTPATPEEHFAAMLANGTTVGLSTTSWQDGGVTRSILAVFANLLGLADVSVSVLNQTGFLDYAATGSVTYTDPVTGDPVTVKITPDPSNPAENPTGVLGALDVIADSVYDVRRILQTNAGGTLAILNTSGITYGPYSAGGYHVAQPEATGTPTYSNTATLSIPPSASLPAVAAISTGTPTSITTAAPHGLSNGDVVFVTGAAGTTGVNGAWQITVTSATVFALVGSAGTGFYTGGAALHSPTVGLFTADAAGSSSNAEEVNVVTQPVTALVGVSVANVDTWIGTDTENNVDLAARCRLKLSALSPNGPAGAFEYFAKSSQQFAPLLTPPQIVAAAITRALVQTDKLTGVVTTTIANASGAPGAGDVAATDAVIQAYCLPSATTEITQAAAEVTVATTVDVWVPAAYATAVVPIAQVAVQAYYRLLPIGGVPTAGGPGPAENVVPIDAVSGAVYAAALASGIALKDIDVHLNSGTDNVALSLSPVPEVAVLSPATPTVTAHIA